VRNGTPHGFFFDTKNQFQFCSAVGPYVGSQGKGNTVLRAGIGLYCENVIYNNIFDRPFREKTGAFLATRIASDGGAATG
jgi:hypothetical protein